MNNPAGVKRAAGEPSIRVGRLRPAMLGLYGFGGLADNIPIYGLGHLLLFYLTIVCGMPGSLAGMVLGLSLVIDAVVEPLIGSLSDNSRSQYGRRHPFMVAGALPLALGLATLYSIPANLGGSALFTYVLSALLVTRVAHAVFNVPYRALGAELSADYKERSLVVASRQLFGALATALATYLAYGIFLSGPKGLTTRAGYVPFAWWCALIILVSAAVSIIGTAGARGQLHVAGRHQRFGFRRFGRELLELGRSQSFRILFLTALVFMVAWGLNSALGLHTYKYFWMLDSKQILIVNEGAVVGSIAGVLLAALLSRRMEKGRVTMIGIASVGLCKMLPVLLWACGLLPNVFVLPTVTITAAVAGAGVSIYLVGYQSMLADAADEHELRFGSRREGLYLSGSSLAIKASAGLGSMMAGFALDFIAFPHGKGEGAILNVGRDTARELGFIQGPGAGVLALAAALILLRYRLDAREHRTIGDALERRRTKSAGPSIRTDDQDVPLGPI